VVNDAGRRAGPVTTALDAIFARRSISRLVEPGPGAGEVELLLAAAAAAPDHGELRPWRFVVVRGEGAGRDFGEVFAEAYELRVARAEGDVVPAKLDKERTKLGRAPLVIAACACHVHDTKIPWIEQQLAVAAACQNILLAATALGYGSMWRTGDNAYDDHIKAALGLGEHDSIVGFLYIGSVDDRHAKPAHPRP
jgi:nitroreductase